MPLYTYECDCGNNFEKVLTVSKCDAPQACPQCGEQARKTITLGHGGYLRPDASWLKGVSDVLEGDTPPEQRQITTTDGYRAFLQDNPNIIPQESHPCVPSSVGDVKKHDPEASAAKRKRRALNNLRQMRRIEVGQTA